MFININKFKYITLFLLIGTILLLGVSCKSSSKAGTQKLKKKSARFLVKKLDQHKNDFEWFAAKAKIDYEDQNFSQHFTSNIRIRKDSVIWMNIKKLGVEAARVLVRPDSIFVINRLDKSYIANSLENLPFDFGLPPSIEEQDVFSVFQSVLYADPIWFLQRSDLEAKIKAKQYLLTGKSDFLNVKYFINGYDFVLESLNLKEAKGNQSLSIDFDSYNVIEEHNFPYFRRLNFSGNDNVKVDVEMKFSKVQINEEKNIKFEIPPHYTRLD